MNRPSKPLARILEQSLPWLVLIILLLYDYAKIFEHPYTGLRWNTGGEIESIFMEGNPQNPLKVGDRLLQVGAMSLSEYSKNYGASLFGDAQQGQVVELVIERDGRQITLPWRVPGVNNAEMLDQVLSETWLALIFWLVGTLTLLVMHPKNERSRLLIVFNYLTAIWIGVGGGASFYHIWYSAFLLRIAVWFCVPVYLHFHWVFPARFRNPPIVLSVAIYVMAGLMAVADCLQLLPPTLYLLGFLVAVVGSLILLIAHAILQPTARNDLRLLLVGGGLSLIPLMLVSVLGIISVIPYLGLIGLLGLPFLPLIYFYAISRRQVGTLELRVNHFIIVYLFMILLGTLGLPLIVLAYSDMSSVPGRGILIGSVVGILVAIISIFLFPPFQSLVEQHLLGIPLPPKKLLESFSTFITTSTSLSQLVMLLENAVLPSLLVRQFVFLHFDRGQARSVLTLGVTEPQIPQGGDLSPLINRSGKHQTVDPDSQARPYSWIRLVLSLNIGDDLLGLWLLGKHDPDDVYSQVEISLLQSLANQTAIALSNILQTERLRELYQANVNRHEQERLQLALDLHDSILNQMAAMLMNMDEAALTPGFQSAYDKLTGRLREIVSDLRPPMLNYGLKPALDELADDLMERNRDVKVNVDLRSDESRYESVVELHLFRIIQEGCENALRHARAKTVLISGKLDPGQIDLQLSDDGVGFDSDRDLELDDLIANKHFGLAGMMERAELIGGKVRIESAPGKGTRIRIEWQPGEAQTNRKDSSANPVSTLA